MMHIGSLQHMVCSIAQVGKSFYEIKSMCVIQNFTTFISRVIKRNNTWYNFNLD
ncbi:hypothetical protein DAI22_11g221000 [Oryza sativa Japonica Group]|nr:hypothetical protein DAI22_11g221000 [Oryza sativa Japonica Group]